MSVITAVHAGRVEHLVETARSLQRQEIPCGWEVEWLIQEDGTAPELDDVLPAMTTDLNLYNIDVRYAANKRQLGPGGTRTLALLRAYGDIIRVLDSDDLLLADALTTECAIFTRHPSVQWVVAQPERLLPHGEIEPYITPLPFGRVAPRTIGDLTGASTSSSALCRSDGTQRCYSRCWWMACAPRWGGCAHGRCVV